MGYLSFYGVLIIIAVIVQSLPISYEIFSGIHPDFLLIISTMVAVNYGRTAGGVLGFLAGLLQDWFSGGLFGIHAISKTLTAYLCGFLRENIYQHHFLTPLLITLFATVVNQVLILMFTKLLVEILVLKEVTKEVIVPLAIWNSIISLFVYPMIYKLESILIRRKFW
ncbi:rod shape-determining protein MreD [Halanaerobacter jeridensis]|uniref:Rod shape-determining protein MreD n=1 Tax=Halanaerobacter jeridensis TaxID=706427 RepID=A0A938XNR8_9FIRM|nr:rod shape-determining protein MreD [Halanaerobacter jeridensis]